MSSSFYATIARYYDSEHHDKDEDFEFYENIATAALAEDDAILIIGSGTGRLALHLAAAGHAVHGIEIEPAMLERARRKLENFPERARVTFHLGDALTLPLERTFGMVIIPYNTLMHFLTLDDQRRVLTRAHDWLYPGGLLVIDLPNAGEAFAAPDTEAVTLERTFIDRETGHPVMQQSSSRLDRAEQRMYVTWIYDEIGPDGALKRTVVPVVIHYFFLREIALLLEMSGFRIDAVMGDFDGAPYGDGAPRMLIIARRDDDDEEAVEPGSGGRPAGR
jgi:SAM-dependent methyltransferase